MWRHCNGRGKYTANVMYYIVHVVPIVYKTEEHNNKLLSVDTPPPLK